MTAFLNLSKRWHLAVLTLLTLLMTLPGLAGIPVIDRDEARYATSSVQMVESGDWLEIRFHDEARNKKPAGAYWAQSVMLKAVGGADALKAGKRPLWAQRLPSVLAGLTAVWLTYFAGLILLGRGGAVLAGGMLATSMIFVFEAHIAKTDALLLASTTAMLLALVRLRVARLKGTAWLFWVAMGVSMMIKGPIGPGLAVISIISLILWERDVRWVKPLLRPLPIIVFLLLWVPWVIAINHATDGAFLAESLGRDLGGKMVSAQENHSGPPGYYALTILISLWPAVLFLLPGLVWGWRERQGDGATARLVRLCLAWIVPFWILLELAPTKLIHYPLPLFPALCLLMAGAVLALMKGNAFKRSRRLSSVLFAIGSVAIVTIIGLAQFEYGAERLTAILLIAAAVTLALCLWAVVAAWRGQAGRAVSAAGLGAVLLSALTYGALMPNVEDGRTSQNLAAAVSGPIATLHYTEPSLVYYAGSERVRLGDVIDWEDAQDWATETLVIDRNQSDVTLGDVREVVARAGRCVQTGESVSGFKYSNFESVELLPIRQVPCN